MKKIGIMFYRWIRVNQKTVIWKERKWKKGRGGGKKERKKEEKKKKTMASAWPMPLMAYKPEGSRQTLWRGIS